MKSTVNRLFRICYGFRSRLWTLDDFKTRYAVDAVYFTDEILNTLQNHSTSNSPPQLLTLTGVNSDSGKTTREASLKGIENFEVINTVLYPHICEW